MPPRALFWMLLLIAVSPVQSCLAKEQLPGPYPADVLRVIDGDTVEVRVHLWPGLSQVTHIRLRDVNTPELHSRCHTQRDIAWAAKDFLTNLLAGQTVHVSQVADDKYGGRFDAYMILSDGQNVSQLIAASGLTAHPACD